MRITSRDIMQAPLSPRSLFSVSASFIHTYRQTAGGDKETDERHTYMHRERERGGG